MRTAQPNALPRPLSAAALCATVLAVAGTAQQPTATLERIVRVVDTDRTRGNRALDSLNVIEIEVVSQGEVEPLAPSAAVATATSSDSVHLAWIAGAGHAHYRVQTEDPLAPGNYIDAVTTPATAIDMAT